MEERLKASCIISILNCGHYNQSVVIGCTGGSFVFSDGEEYNIWQLEIDNSIHVDDIFCGYDCPEKPGFYVWEGEIEPVEDDQPNYYGEWRNATKEDMAGLINKTT